MEVEKYTNLLKKTNKEEYIRKMIELGCNPLEYNNIVIISDTSLDNVKHIFLKLKEEYNIDQMLFIDRDERRLYEFFKTNPSEEEIDRYVEKQPELKNPEKTKIIFNYPSHYDGYSKRLSNEYKDQLKLYRKIDRNSNGAIYDLSHVKEHLMITCIPDKSWAKYLLGSKNKEKKLWNLVNKIVPNTKEYRELIEKNKEIEEYLSKSRIKNLHFYSNLGTDFNIGLSSHSLWTTEPEIVDNKEFFFNFPSYEIYTSPNAYTAKGKIVLSKACIFYGNRISEGEFTFERGKCKKVDTDCDYFNKVVKNKKNNMDRIGEVALVSNDSPIAILNRTFDNLLLDENAGCHFALGYAINECIDIDKEKLMKKGKKYYKFNDSRYHHDLVFGNESITVEADLGNNKKVLLLENGAWRI